jgi:hypothetical protein
MITGKKNSMHRTLVSRLCNACEYWKDLRYAKLTSGKGIGGRIIPADDPCDIVAWLDYMYFGRHVWKRIMFCGNGSP